MHYKATFKANLGFYSIFAVFGLLGVWVGARAHEAVWVAIGLLSISFLLLIRLRLYVSCGDEALETRTLLRTSKVPWDQIREVKRVAETGYWASRFYGPFTYQFKTSSGFSIKINFKFYSRECAREIMWRVSSQFS